MSGESVLIAVLTTNNDWVYPSILQLIHKSAALPNHPVALLTLHNVIPVSAARNRAAKVLLTSRLDSGPMDWVLMIDNDMDPPWDLLSVLDLPGAAERDVIACRCQLVGWGGDTIENAWLPLTGSHEPRPWLELARAGTGAIFIRRRVFERLVPPWFDFTLGPDGELQRGEDFYFSDRVRQAGFRLWGLDEPRYEVGHVRPVNLSNIAPALRRIGNAPVPAPASKAFGQTGNMARRELRWRDAKPFVPVEAERNDPCPCGSGRKFKKCCGVA